MSEMNKHGFVKAEGLQINKDKDIEEQIRVYDRLLDNFTADINRMESEGHLTKAGQAAAMHRLRKELLPSLQDAIPDYQNRMDYMKKTMTSELKTDPENQILDYFREREYREHLSNMDPVKVNLLYEEATRKGDDTLLERAIENAPKLLNLIDPEKIEEGKSNRIRRLHPELVKHIEDLENLKNTAIYNYRMALKAIGHEESEDQMEGINED